MLVHPSGIDVSTSALRYLSARLRARRQERGTRWRRVSVGRQALLVLAHCGAAIPTPSSPPGSPSA